MSQPIRVENWSELNEELYRHSWNPELERFRSNYIFRGMADSSHPLTTCLTQLGEHYPEVERHILRNFIKYAYLDALTKPSFWHMLALAQHHGLPTRLLDWTYSPYVAVHFATVDLERIHQDGVIWCLDYIQANERLPERFRRLLNEEGTPVFTVELLNEVVAGLEDLDSQDASPFVVFFEPPSLDARIVNQFALFSMMSSPIAQMDAWLDAHPELYRKIIIPAELKWQFRDKLDQANINERVLFPGLDGLSSWLKRYYSTRNR